MSQTCVATRCMPHACLHNYMPLSTPHALGIVVITQNQMPIPQSHGSSTLEKLPDTQSCPTQSMQNLSQPLVLSRSVTQFISSHRLSEPNSIDKQSCSRDMRRHMHCRHAISAQHACPADQEGYTRHNTHPVRTRLVMQNSKVKLDSTKGQHQANTQMQKRSQRFSLCQTVLSLVHSRCLSLSLMMRCQPVGRQQCHMMTDKAS